MKFIYCLLGLIVGIINQASAIVNDVYDVVIYGGTSAGVIAAHQVSRMGKTVALIEKSHHLGGMTTSGLGYIDVNNAQRVGGLTQEYFHRVWRYYQNDSAWIWEAKHPMKGQYGNPWFDEEMMWVVEPHVAEQIFTDMIHAAGIHVAFGERLDRKHGVVKSGQRIVKITMESGRSFSGKMFIDATYEGDLMALADVSYIVGREPNSRYNEIYNGLKPNFNYGHVSIDPFLVQGDPSSGLLPRVYPDLGGLKGEGDDRVQAYNYRMCLTDVPENRILIEKPLDYDERDYEIIFRAIESGENMKRFLKLSRIPNLKTDTNNHGPYSTDFIGMSWDYPEANYSERDRIAKKHEMWQRGLIWTLQNHPRVPPEIRALYAPWGLAKDEFADNRHWPRELYVREARRMVSDVVITENMALSKIPVSDSIGVATYHMDSHCIKYYVNSDHVLATDGSVFEKVPVSFYISYGAIIPKKEECENLLVPVCLSASHVAFGSLRTEPVLMILGQSAATAACVAINQKVSVQDISYAELRTRLLADDQIVK
ncbi:MAG TPA: FAD-dependent oxidoreductase [Rhabdochlamydiaceae bacterium]|nr:FAD-dependent oxidoreductase [Rhabdochlamydiaceae bacterium]